jgi:hypothetical protein
MLPTGGPLVYGLVRRSREVPIMHDPDAQPFRLALESVRDDLVAAIRAFRESGGRDEELVLLVDAQHPGKPRVSTATRLEVERSIPDFDPTLAIAFAKHVPGQAPAVVDVRDYVRRVVWIDLTPPLTW